MISKQAGTILQHIRRLARTPGIAQPSDAELLERFASQRDQGAFATLSVMKRPEFTVSGSNPRFIQHLEKGLVGVLPPLPGERDTVTVRLQPGAAITGRLMNAQGQPRAKVALDVTFRPGKQEYFEAYSPEQITTDPEGRFRLNALLPDCTFQLSDGNGELTIGTGLRAGETKELGDVRLERPRE